jgi:hypothetical protein
LASTITRHVERAWRRLSDNGWTDDKLIKGVLVRPVVDHPGTAKLPVGDGIERVHTCRGRHSAPLDMMSPAEFTDRLTRTAQVFGPYFR